MGILSKLQPVFIVLAAITGIITGKLFPGAERYAGACIELFLMIMLFFVFLAVDIRDISRTFRDVRFSAAALAINFVWTPLFVFALTKIFLPESADLQIGFIMLMVTPCTDWYLIFTGLAGGNVTLGASVLPLNLILQILLLPVYLLLFMGKAVPFDPAVILKSVVLVLAVPLLVSNTVKFLAGRAGAGRLLARVTAASDAVQFVLLCLAVVSMFASQGVLLLDNLSVFVTLLLPLLLFFAAVFLLSCAVGKILKLPFRDTIPLLFTASARNSPVSLAIAAITFPERPVISLVLVMGPLIELPVLGLNAFILKTLSPRLSPRRSP